MLGAAVPEAAVDEDGEAAGDKDDVGLAGQFVPDAVAKAKTPELLSELQLGSGVFPLVGGHATTALFLSEDIGPFVVVGHHYSSSSSGRRISMTRPKGRVSGAMDTPSGVTPAGRPSNTRMSDAAKPDRFSAIRRLAAPSSRP